MEQVQAAIRAYIAKNILFTKNGFPYADDASLLDEGVLDSMNVLELVSFIEDTFSIDVDDLEIIPEHFDSVQKMAAFVQQKNGISMRQ